MKGYMYILQCALGYYYTGSTIDLDRRIKEHNTGNGSNFTKKHLPIELIYSELFDHIEDAFKREKQVQGWSRRKKEALINNQMDRLNKLSQCINESHSNNKNKIRKYMLYRTFRLRRRNTLLFDIPFDSAQGTESGH